MSVVVIGLSHRSAPLPLLEQVALDPARRARLLELLQASAELSEVLLLDTCNRVEVYAEAVTFHGAVTAISAALSAATGVPQARLRDHLYVHYADRAVSHLFGVSAGLDSMAVGESQILGQLRESLRLAREDGRVGAGLDGLVQQALRVGKRAHSETGIDGVSRSLVERGLGLTTAHLGPLGEQRVLVVGAGAMSGLAAHTVARAGAASLTVVNRTPEAGRRLATRHGARAVPWEQLPQALAEADLVISCTGAVGHVVEPALLAGAPARQAFVDLALPRDVDPQVAQRPGALVISLADLGHVVEGEDDQVEAVRALVGAEVEDYLTARRAAAVAPTVALLRARAAEVVGAEMTRLEQRLPQMSESDAAQVRLAVHRVVEKLLHTPTVRVKELAGQGHDHTAALRELFDLDPRHPQAVSRPEVAGPRTRPQEDER